jgi:hypothetical protein
MVDEVMTCIDIRPLLAALDDPGKLGEITALSAMIEKLAQRDGQYAVLDHAIAELWPAMIAKNPVKVRQAACKVLDECNRLGNALSAWKI